MQLLRAVCMCDLYGSGRSGPNRGAAEERSRLQLAVAAGSHWAREVWGAGNWELEEALEMELLRCLFLFSCKRSPRQQSRVRW